MGRLVAAILVSAAGALPAFGASEECRCRGSDGRIFYEGDLACIRTAQGPKLARCEMALNNTTWTIVRDNCPEALWFSPVRLVTFSPAKDDGRPARW